MSYGVDRVDQPAPHWLSHVRGCLPVFGPREANAADSNLESMVRALVREIEVTSQLALASCVVFNALQIGIPISVASLHRYYPNRPKVLTAILRSEMSLHLDKDSTCAFSNLHDAAALAIELARGTISISGSIKSTSNVAGVAQAWRATSVHAVEALQQARVLLLNTGVAYRIPDPERMIYLLQQAADGATSGVNADGTIAGRSINEDRRHPRYFKSFPATLTYGESSQPAIVRDMSCGGCGIDIIKRLPIGGHVRMSLSDLSTFEGKIVWACGLRAGLKFDHQLTEAEVMLSGER
jgi:hypothetical protein